MPASNNDPKTVAGDIMSDLNKATNRMRRLIKASTTPDYVKADLTSALDATMGAYANVLDVALDRNKPAPVTSASAPKTTPKAA